MELGINSTPSVQPNEVENFIKEGFVLVDVREIDEWTSGHHVNAIHIPMGEIMENMNSFHQDEKYIFVCRSGSRSARVTNYMISQDIEAYDMSGGMKELRNFTKKIYDSEGNPGQII